MSSRFRSFSARPVACARTALATMGFLATLAWGLPPAWAEEAHSAGDQVVPPPNPDLVFPLDDADPKSSLPSPQERADRPLEYGYLLMEMTGRAEEAMEAGDFVRATRYFEALTVALPDAALGHRKLCLARANAGDPEGAVSACRRATQTAGTVVSDLARFLETLVVRPTAPSADELAEFDRTLAHAEQQGVDLRDVLAQSCQLGLRLRDDVRLEGCVRRLQAIAPSEARTHGYAWALAVRQRDEAAAEKALAAARAAGYDPAKLASMEVTMGKTFRASRPWIWLGLAVAVLAALAAIALGRRSSKAPAAGVALPKSEQIAG